MTRIHEKSIKKTGRMTRQLKIEDISCFYQRSSRYIMLFAYERNQGRYSHWMSRVECIATLFFPPTNKQLTWKFHECPWRLNFIHKPQPFKPISLAIWGVYLFQRPINSNRLVSNGVNHILMFDSGRRTKK